MSHSPRRRGNDRYLRVAATHPLGRARELAHINISDRLQDHRIVEVASRLLGCWRLSPQRSSERGYHSRPSKANYAAAGAGTVGATLASLVRLCAVPASFGRDDGGGGALRAFARCGVRNDWVPAKLV